jgi:hypothetical protein
MLPKHPDQYTDDELLQWVTHLVDDRVEEGPRLDYKADILLAEHKQRREAAKDISSFANEIGGTLLYGIPEDRGSAGAPVPTTPYGIEPVADLEQKFENIYVDSIRPTLPEWRIRKVALSEFPGKVVYVVWTPESWLGPHMVESHRDWRYYRRGQFRSVEMAEHEVRARYERLSRLRDLAGSIVEDMEKGALAARFDQPCGSHYLAYPAYSTYDRVDFSTTEMRAWLARHSYPPNPWMAALSGVQTLLERTSGRARGEWSPYARITREGAVSVWRHTAVALGGDREPESITYGEELREVGLFLVRAGELFKELRYVGPVRLRLRFNARGYPLRIPQSPGYPNLEYQGSHPLVVEVEVPSSDLVLRLEHVSQQLADEFMRAFGRWGTA